MMEVVHETQCCIWVIFDRSHCVTDPAIRCSRKEAQHLARGVRAARIGVGAGEAAARPGVSGTMDLPALEARAAGRIEMDGAGIGVSCVDPAAMHLRFPARRSPGLRNHMIAVAGMHHLAQMPPTNMTVTRGLDPCAAGFRPRER